MPIAIDVLDAKGKSVYRNDIPGIEPALAAVPFIPAGGEADWVHDQVLATGKPAKVEVKVGEGGEPVQRRAAGDLRLRPEARRRPLLGRRSPAATSKTRAGEDLERLLLYAVASKGGKIVAAGRGAIEPFKAKPKPRPLQHLLHRRPAAAPR